jgi:hypothetical protein
MKRSLRLLRFLSTVFTALVAPPAIEATTYLMVSDEALADQASVVAEVQVVEAGPSPAAGPPATDYLVDVERVVQGDLLAGRIVVRVPGGEGADGLGLRIAGAPRFAAGERALLFLVAGDDGAYRILHLMLGAFHEVRSGGRRLAVRDLAGAHEVVVGPDGEPTFHDRGLDRPRDLERFAAWLGDRAAGRRRPADYLEPEGSALEPEGTAIERSTAPLEQATAPFSLMTAGDGHPIRWFGFEAGATVSWRVHGAGQAGLGIDASIAAFRAGIDAWNGDAGSGVRYAYAGTTSAATGFARSDGVNAILFDDPQRAEGDGAFSCASGGVVAVGGPYFRSATRSFAGRTYHEAVEGDIVTNDGTECFFRGNQRVAEEVFAHELGHTLGIGHSGTRDALMWASVHDDGRGARLSADDREAVASLYPAGGGSPNPSPPPPSPPPPVPPPPAPACGANSTVLCLLDGRLRVDVTWRNQHTGARGAGRVLAAPGATSRQSGLLWFFASGNAELVVKAIDGRAVNGHFWVFLGGLTDVEYWLKVTDTVAGSSRTYHNRPGIQGALGDTLALPAAVRGKVLPAREVPRPSGLEAPAARKVAASACAAGPRSLCLLGGRFRVEVTWRNQHAGGATGAGRAVPLTGQTGTFWFFGPESLELVIKVLDGRAVNGKFWVFYGALTDVEYWLTVTDTRTGAVRTYHSRPGSLVGRSDTAAF